MKSYLILPVILFYLLLINNCQKESTGLLIRIYPDSILSDVSNHPVGINLDYFMDDDNYLKPQRSTTDALKAMGVKYLRYPGGNKSDFYFFSVPPYEKSVPTLARTGKGAVGGRHKMLDNYSGFKYDVLDFDEFMAMCKEIGGEPTICVAADEYLVDYPEGCTKSSREELIEHAVEWVRYANIKKKYNVKYWMIGNESWHKQNVNSTPEIYANDVIAFSKAMKAVDSTIYIIPNGNGVKFWEPVIKKAGDYIDYLCMSNYPVYEYKSGYLTYRDTLQNLTLTVKDALTALDKFGTEQQKKRLKLIVCEYGSMDWAGNWPYINNMGHTLCTFEMTGEFLKEPKVEFSQFWNTRWIDNDEEENSIFDALDKNGNFNSNGYALSIWGNFLGEKMVKTTSTIHIRSFASYVPETGILCVYLLNKTDSTQTVNLQIENSKIKSLNQHWVLAGDNSDDTDPVFRKEEITSGKNPQEIILPGTSISVLEYIIKK